MPCMKEGIQAFARSLLGSLRDLTPIIVVIAFFEIVVLQQPPPQLGQLLLGTGLVVLGLTFFIHGLEMGLFPLGEALAFNFAAKGNLWWLLAFAFALGFGTTVAEPALIAIAEEAAEVAAQAAIIPSEPPRLEWYADSLRYTVALSVGTAIVLGVYRIVRGWPIHWFIVSGYLLVVLMTALAPRSIIGIAYDSGGVTTSTLTVPLVTALGVGLANSIEGRNPMVEGFGLIAFASLTPMLFVMLFGIVVH